MMKNVFKKLKHRSLKLRPVSMFLAIVFVCIACPFSAYAVVETENTIEMQQNNDEISKGVFETVGEEYSSDDMTGEITELVSLREENVKHFKMTDGTYRAVTYANEVHRKDATGVWQEIDNRLIEKKENDVGLYSSSDGRVSFVRNFAPNQPMFTLSENGKSISLSMISNQLSAEDDVTLREIAPTETDILATVVNAEQRADSSRWETFEEAARINTSTSVYYANVEEDTDLEYVLEGNDIKENIIVNRKRSSYVYRFFLETESLFASLQDDGQIELRDSKTAEVCYIIPAPYMYDATGDVSNSVTYSLVMKKNGYELKITADAKWINSDERSFPITIDPSIFTTMSGLQDTHIYSGGANVSYASSTTLEVGDGRIAFVKFSIPRLPSGAELYYAMINLAYFHSYTSGSITVGAYQVLQNFNYPTLTWNIAYSCANMGVSTTMIGTDILPPSNSITSSSPGDAQFEITSAVNFWYANPSKNYGIALKYYTGSIPYVMFKAKEAGGGYQPYMTVAYTYEFPEGVYAISNLAVSNRWMTVEGGNSSSGYHIQQKLATVSPADASVFDRTSLFKISRKAGDFFIVRSMLNNRLSFGLSGTKFVTKEIPSADADVALADTFRIEWNGQGFLIYPYARALCIAMSSASVADLTVVNKNQATVAATWCFEQYSGTHKQSAILTYPSSWRSTGAVVGETYTASIDGWSTHIDGNTLMLEVNPTHTDLGSSTWNSSTNQITLTANAPGELSLRVQLKYGDGVVFYTGYYNYQIVPRQGTYYIQNAGTERYIDVEGPSTLSGAAIQQWEFHTGNQERWILEHVANSNGYVRLKSAYSNLYIGVDLSNTTSIKQYSTQNDYTLWKIDRSSSGNLILLCKATTGALSVPLTSNQLGTNLTQVSYTSDANNRDEWYLYRLSGYTVNVSVLYDNAYSNRYSDAYSRINDQILVLQEKYMQDIGIIVNDMSLTIFSSYADTYCTTDHTVECSHTTETCRNSRVSIYGTPTLYSLHHTNIYNIMYRIPFPDLSYTVKVAYIGHELCTETNHDGHPFYGLTSPTVGIATIMNFSSEASETRTLIHEFGHFYGIEDHYGTPAISTDEIKDATGNAGYNRCCIYGEERGTPSVLNDFTICDGCKTTLRDNMSRFAH